MAGDINVVSANQVEPLKTNTAKAEPPVRAVQTAKPVRRQQQNRTSKSRGKVLQPPQKEMSLIKFEETLLSGSESASDDSNEPGVDELAAGSAGKNVTSGEDGETLTQTAETDVDLVVEQAIPVADIFEDDEHAAPGQPACASAGDQGLKMADLPSDFNV